MNTYLVGGAVRDSLMGIVPTDFDYVVVGSTPAEMEAQGYTPVGVSFPVYLHPQHDGEYALARTERKTGEGYQGFTTETTGVTLEADLARRDLTINSIAYDNETGQYIDPCGGIEDISRRVLRHTSDAFADDPLRVIRLARMYARYVDFSIDHSTVLLVHRIIESGEMDTIPHERYWAELHKVFADHSLQAIGVVRFTAFLHMTGALSKIQFFKDVFGASDYSTLNAVGEKFIVHFAKSDPELAVALWITTLVKYSNGSTKFSMPALPTRVSKLLQLSSRLANPQWSSAEFNLGILESCGAFGNSTRTLADVVAFLHTIEDVRGAIVLMLSHVAAKSVTSEPYLHLKGPAIGAAIRAARAAAIEKSLSPDVAGD